MRRGAAISRLHVFFDSFFFLVLIVAAVGAGWVFVGGGGRVERAALDDGELGAGAVRHPGRYAREMISSIGSRM